MNGYRLLLLAALVSGLPAAAQSYLKLHEKAIVVDTHNDVLSEATLKGLDIGTDLTGKAMSDLARLEKGRMWTYRSFPSFATTTLGLAALSGRPTGRSTVFIRLRHGIRTECRSSQTQRVSNRR